jgi:hypothetical protein
MLGFAAAGCLGKVRPYPTIRFGTMHSTNQPCRKRNGQENDGQKNARKTSDREIRFCGDWPDHAGVCWSDRRRRSAKKVTESFTTVAIQFIKQACFSRAEKMERRKIRRSWQRPRPLQSIRLSCGLLSTRRSLFRRPLVIFCCQRHSLQ